MVKTRKEKDEEEGGEERVRKRRGTKKNREMKMEKQEDKDIAK